jgi:hypothetical protein
MIAPLSKNNDLPTNQRSQQQLPLTHTDDKTIKVWRFEGAPREYRDLSTNGGDEDWIAFIPSALAEEYIGWLESGSSFGCCCVDEYKVEGGVICIGCHS